MAVYEYWVSFFFLLQFSALSVIKFINTLVPIIESRLLSKVSFQPHAQKVPSPFLVKLQIFSILY